MRIKQDDRRVCLCLLLIWRRMAEERRSRLACSLGQTKYVSPAWPHPIKSAGKTNTKYLTQLRKVLMNFSKLEVVRGLSLSHLRELLRFALRRHKKKHQPQV